MPFAATATPRTATSPWCRRRASRSRGDAGRHRPRRRSLARQRWPLMASAGARRRRAAADRSAVRVQSEAEHGDGIATAVAPSDHEPPNAADTAAPTQPITIECASADPAVTPVAEPPTPTAAGADIEADPRATPSSSARSRSGRRDACDDTIVSGDDDGRVGADPDVLEQARDDETTLSARREAANLLPQAHGAQVVTLRARAGAVVRDEERGRTRVRDPAGACSIDPRERSTKQK